MLWFDLTLFFLLHFHFVMSFHSFPFFPLVPTLHRVAIPYHCFGWPLCVSYINIAFLSSIVFLPILRVDLVLNSCGTISVYVAPEPWYCVLSIYLLGTQWCLCFSFTFEAFDIGFPLIAAVQTWFSNPSPPFLVTTWNRQPARLSIFLNSWSMVFFSKCQVCPWMHNFGVMERKPIKIS